MENELMSLPMVALRGLAVMPEICAGNHTGHEKRSESISCNAEGS